MPTRRALLLAALVCALLYAVYSGVGRNPFHYDDFHSIRDNPHLVFSDGLVRFFYDPGPAGQAGFAGAATRFSVDPERAMYRPLLLVSYVVNNYTGLSYQWLNLGIHGLNALVLAAVLAAAGVAAGPLAGGVLIFALHPLQAEVINYASARSESLMALFFLLALWGHILGCNSGRRRYFVGAAVFLAAALMTKAVAVTFVAVAFLYSWKRSAWRGWEGLIAYGLLVLVYLGTVRQAVGTALGDPVRGYGVQAMTQAKAAVYYLYLSFFPAHLSVEHGFNEGAAQQAAVGLAFLLVLSAVYGLWRWRNTAWGLLSAWALVVLVPTAVVPLHVLVNEHRLYLSLAFVAPLAAAAVWAVPVWRYRWLYGLVGLGVLGVLAHQRGLVWRDGEVLWRDAVERAPHMFRSRMHLGEVLQGKGELPEAIEHFAAATRAAPDRAETHYNLANALAAGGRLAEAVEIYGRSLHADPFFAPARLNLASALLADGQWQRAKTVLDSALKLAVEGSREAGEVQARLGTLYKRQGRLQEAEKALQQALVYLPDHVGARFNLANLYFDSGRLQDASTHYRAAIAVDGTYSPAYANLGDALLRQRRFTEALQVYESGLRTTAARAIFYFGAGRSYEGTGQLQAARVQYRACLEAADATPRLQEAAQRRLEALAINPGAGQGE